MSIPTDGFETTRWKPNCLEQRGKMTSSKNIIKSVTAKDYLVVSAKVPEWFFNTIDIFKPQLRKIGNISNPNFASRS